MSSAADAFGAPTRPPRSIAWRIFALVVASVTVATAALFAITFNGPPPRIAPLTVEDAARALLTGRAPPRDRPPPPDPFHAQDRRPPGLAPHHPPMVTDLLISVSAAAPPPRPGERADPRRAAAIAEALRTPADRVVAYVSDQPAEFRLTMVDSVTVGWNTGRGWRVLRTPAQPLLTRWHLVTLAAMAAMLALLSAFGWRVSRAVGRPSEQLAVAAEQARAGAPLPPLPAGGPAEVRQLTRAVAAMHERLGRHAEQRTNMLAAIAHDLGTPLARLAFWIEQLPDAARDRAAADLDEMRAMLADTLGFARDEAGERDQTRVDLGSLLDSLVEDMSIGGSAATLAPGPRAVVRGDPRGLRRLFQNLINNAVRYGDRARVSWSVEPGLAVVLVEDDGPGIDPADAERLFEPFVRGETSRNRATGGTGLGLAIVRAVAARHGGRVTLENTGSGSARARVSLPLAA